MKTAKDGIKPGLEELLYYLRTNVFHCVVLLVIHISDRMAIS